MSDDTDVCGHPTDGGDGPPCQHPVTDDGDSDRCWVDKHNESETTSGNGGRSFAIKDTDHDDILEAARMGASKAGCARAAGVDKASLLRYLEAHSEFRTAFTQARAKGEQRLLKGPLWNEQDAPKQMDGQHARFLLSTSFKYQKTERKEHLVDDDADLSNDGVTAEFVVIGDDESDE